MSRLCLLPLLIALGAAAAEEPSAAPAGYPFEGQVNASKVRVRAGGNKNEREIAVLSQGDAVTVLEEQYGWYRIRCPQGCKAWINAKFVKEVPGPVTGPVQLELTGDNVLLRASDSLKASQMGAFPKGTILTSVRRKGDWYEVLCPPEASAWVSAKYVTPVNGAQAPPLTEPPPPPAPATSSEPEAPREDPPRPAEPVSDEARRFSELEASRAALMPRPLDEADFEPLIKGYRAIAESTRDPVLADRCRTRASELTERQQLRDQLRSGLLQAREDLQRQLEEINVRYEQRLQEILASRQKVRSPSEFAETGWVGGVGRIVGCPATHRLNKGGEHLVFLRSDKAPDGSDLVDLDRNLNQYVGVNGDRLHDPRWGDILVVREIQVLAEP